MKHRLFNLFIVIVASIASLSASAQSTLTPEETAFLKSLNGKWNDIDGSQIHNWGTHIQDIQFIYVNGNLKLQYTSKIFTDKGKDSCRTEIKVK